MITADWQTLVEYLRDLAEKGISIWRDNLPSEDLKKFNLVFNEVTDLFNTTRNMEPEPREKVLRKIEELLAPWDTKKTAYDYYNGLMWY